MKITPDGPDFFRGQPDLYRAWVQQNPPRFNPYLCPKHWMPCPVEGKNGMLASVLMMTEAFAFLPANVTTPDAMNSWFANQTTSVCCRFGDEKMAWLWWIVAASEDPERFCRARTPEQNVSVRVCWRWSGHKGEHEWERPLPRSVFDLMTEVHP